MHLKSITHVLPTEEMPEGGWIISLREGPLRRSVYINEIGVSVGETGDVLAEVMDPSEPHTPSISVVSWSRFEGTP